jgi:hypothetical protein
MRDSYLFKILHALRFALYGLCSVRMHTVAADKKYVGGRFESGAAGNTAEGVADAANNLFGVLR